VNHNYDRLNVPAVENAVGLETVCWRYSIYSVKRGCKDEARGISELGGQEPTP
jgi:hypothetical protein